MAVRYSCIVLLSLAILALAACGSDDSGPTTTVGGQDKGSLGPPTILSLQYDAGDGKTENARLTCADGQSDGAGYLKNHADTSCEQVESLKKLLTEPPPSRRVCASIYGGPQTLRVTGRVDFETADQRFSRTNSCEIADWKRLAPLLPR